MTNNRYYTKNRCKWTLKTHVVLVTKYRRKLLRGPIDLFLKRTVRTFCQKIGVDVLAMETDIDHIHLLLGYQPTDRICDIIKSIKQTTTYKLWKQFPVYLGRNYWGRKIFWSDGYFTTSIGEVSTETVERYIASQG